MRESTWPLMVFAALATTAAVSSDRKIDSRAPAVVSTALKAAQFNSDPELRAAAQGQDSWQRLKQQNQENLPQRAPARADEEPELQLEIQPL